MDETGLNKKVQEWADAGLIGDEQVRAIGERAGAGPPPGARMTLLAEVLGFVGGAFALGAIAVLLIEYNAVMGVYGLVGIALTVGIAGLVSGLIMARMDSVAAARLAQFLMFVGVVGVAAAAGFGSYEVAKTAAAPIAASELMFPTAALQWAWFVALATAAVVGGIVWGFHKTTMQHVAFGLGVGLGTLVMLPLLPVEGPEWGAGLVLAIVGVGWGVLGLKGLLPPVDAALSLAALGVLGGIELMAVAGDAGPLAWALWLGLAVAAAMTAASIPMKRSVLLGFGAAGVVLFSFQLIMDTFGSTIAGPIALLIVGVIFVAMAVLVGVMLPRLQDRRSHGSGPTGATPVGV